MPKQAHNGRGAARGPVATAGAAAAPPARARAPDATKKRPRDVNAPEVPAPPGTAGAGGGANLGDMSFDELMRSLSAPATASGAGAVQRKAAAQPSVPRPAVKAAAAPQPTGKAAVPARAVPMAPAATATAGAPARGATAGAKRAVAFAESASEDDDEEGGDSDDDDDDDVDDADGSDDDGDDDSGGDDDGGAAPDGDAAGSNDGGGGDAGSSDGDVPTLAEHRAELARLEAKDPAFFAFLKKNGSGLLAFGEEDGDDDGDEDGDGSGGEAADGGEGDSDEGAARGPGGAAAEVEEEEEDDGDAGAAAPAADADAAAPGRARRSGPERLTMSGLRELLRAALPPPRAAGAGGAPAAAAPRPAGSHRALVKLSQAFRSAVFSGGDGGDVPGALGLRPDGAAPARSAGNRQGRVGRSGERRRARPDGADDGGDDDGAEGGGGGRRLRYAESSGAVYMAVVVRVLQAAPRALASHLGARRGSSAGAAGAAAAGGPAARVPLADYAGWEGRVAPVARSLLTSLVRLLSTATDAGLLLFLLRAARPLLPYAAPFAALTRKLLKALLRIFGGDAAVVPPPPPPGTPDDDDAAADAAADAVSSVRLAAYLRLRQAGTALPYPSLDAVLRGLYLAYVRSAQFVNENTAPALMLAANCVAEAFGLDEAAAYTHAFVFLRQLALHLRAALTLGGGGGGDGGGTTSAGGGKKARGKGGAAPGGAGRSAVAVVASWQFVNCLRLWTAVVSRYGASPGRPLFQLAYPLAQLLQGAVKALPGPRHFPLRLHCAAALVELSWATGLFTPVAPMLLDVLRCPALTRKPTAAAPAHGNAIVLPLMVRIGASSLATRAGQDALVTRALELLLDATRAHYASPALPEIVAPTVAALRGFAKATKVAAWRGRARALVDAFAAQAAVVAARRAALGAAPGDRVALAGFMGAEAEALRAERAVARAAAAAAAMVDARERAKAAAAAARAGRRGGGDDDDEDDGEEGESDDEGGDSGDGDAASSGGSDGGGGDGSDGPETYEEPQGRRGGGARRTAAAADDGGGGADGEDAFPEMEIVDVSDDDDNVVDADVAAAAAAAAAARRAAKRRRPRGRAIPTGGAADEVADVGIDDL